MNVKQTGTLAKDFALGWNRTLWARWRAAEDFIAKHGSVYTLKDASGQARCVMPFPQVAIAHRLSLALTRLEAEFGMTPSARSRIHVELRPEGPSRMAKYFEEYGGGA